MEVDWLLLTHDLYSNLENPSYMYNQAVLKKTVWHLLPDLQ